VVLVSSIIAFIFVLQLGNFSLAYAITMGLICGLAAAFVESISSHGLDNLTIQLTAAGVLHYLIF
jgi:phytol kinase